LVLGSDSLVVVEGRRFDKPASRDEAATHLRHFSGKAMELHSAAALTRRGGSCGAMPHWRGCRCGTCPTTFIEAYLDAEWPAVAHCVGVFRIEGRGCNCSSMEGDQFTVLGMPLLPVLGALRDLGELPA
jgi:septum formation protein